MKLINSGYEILTDIDGDKVLKDIENVARTCYKSHDHTKEGSAAKLVDTLIKSGHHAMLEFFDITVRFTCDRGVSHEIVRHRVASYAQESTRYCNYSKDKFGNELTFIEPYWLTEALLDDTDNARERLIFCLQHIEEIYMSLLNKGLQPQAARAILPNCLKTELNVKMNLREWRHFFNLRCSKAAHPDLRKLALPLLAEFKAKLPIVFDDLYEKYCEEE